MIKNNNKQQKQSKNLPLAASKMLGCKLTKTVILTLILSGCSLAPQYATPDVPMSQKWIGVALKEQGATEVKPSDIGWRQFFTDPRLQKLIETALEHNHDLRKAALSVELAQAQYGIKQADLLPTVGLSGDAKRSRQGSAMGRSNISEKYSVGLGISNFELDFFGRVRNTADASLNDYLATREARDSAQLSVINAVAKTYYQWRAAKAFKDLAQKVVHNRKKKSSLTRLRLQEGFSSSGALSTTRMDIASAQSTYQQRQRAFLKAETALAALVGQPLASLNLPKGKTLSKQFPKKRLFVGVPSKVLLNRPDIRQAEYSLKSTNANIGAARAALFPSISLTANTGYASGDLSNLVSDSKRLWSIGPSINLPIFDMGRRKAAVKISEISKKMAVEDYQKAVQAAFRDVNDALVARKTLVKQYAAERRGVSAANQNLRLVKLQVQEGLANGLNYLDAQRGVLSISQGSIATLLTMTNNQVDLYTALGGGLTEKK